MDDVDAFGRCEDGTGAGEGGALKNIDDVVDRPEKLFVWEEIELRRSDMVERERLRLNVRRLGVVVCLSDVSVMA